MTENDGKDIFSMAMMQGLYEQLKANKEADADLTSPWFTFTNAPEDWWSNLPVKDVEISVGNDEMLRDDILTISERWQVRIMALQLSHDNADRAQKKHTNGSVNVQKLPDQKHCHFMMDMIMKSEPGLMQKHMNEWLESV